MGLSKGSDVEDVFHLKWVDLIMVEVSSLSYSRFIKPSRGICQGDHPLSPYLFLLCTKRFSVLLRNATHHKDLHGVSISKNGPQITHLLFTDDNLLFCNVSLSKCRIIKEITHACKLASGQKINCDKAPSFSAPAPPNP